MSNTSEETTATDGSADSPQRRAILRSEIAFPYVNMEDATELARTMQQAGGVPMTRDQLADQLGVNSDLSTFQNKIGAARQFGFILAKEGKLYLQDTGHRIVSDDEQEVRAAKHTAFLNVELYRRLFEHFRGKPLPPSTGIVAVLKSFGVSEKQADKARQAFEKSALFAGFLNAAKDRLVEPLIIPKQETSIKEPTKEELFPPPPPKKVPEAALQHSELPALAEPLIHGILARLPAPGKEWGARDRVRWLKTLVSILETVYTAPDNTEGDIGIEIKLIQA